MESSPSGKARGLEAKLARYSALAGAAAATAPAADAAIVHVVPGVPITVVQNSFVGWNIDGMGGDEFSFRQVFRTNYIPGSGSRYCVAYSDSESSICTRYSTFIGPGSTYTVVNSLQFYGSGAGFATEGSSNAVVEDGDVFNPNGAVTYFSAAQSPFVSGAQTIGFQFNGQNGWANLTVGPQSLQITEWAYQTAAGVPIVKGQIPEPSSLALLAAGAAGLGLYRRRRQTVTAGE